MYIKKRMLIICVMGICLMIVGAYRWGKWTALPKREKFNINVKYGDDFSKINMLNGKGGDSSLSEGAYKVILYLDSQCSACMKKMSAMKHYQKVFKGENVEFYVLWADKMAKVDYKSVGMEEAKILQMKHEQISTDIPTAYILDKANKVIYITDDTSTVTRKLFTLEGIDRERVKKKAADYLKKEFKKGSKIPVIYFAMDGCPDCEAVDPVVYSEEIKKEAEIVKLYTEESYGEQGFVDMDEIFMSVFDISWYPSFLVLAGEEYKVIGETNVSQLEEELLRSFSK